MSEYVMTAAQVLAEQVLAYVAPPPERRANPMLDADLELQALSWTVLDALGYPKALECRQGASARLRAIVEALAGPRRQLPTDAVLAIYHDSPKDKAEHFAEDILSALSAPAPSKVGREEIAQAAWEAARFLSLAEGEDDSGPWPPTAGEYGWQEDDSEMCRETELAKAEAILALWEPRP